mmetsp:Transcript_17090/g.51899  ORF Transcript_17090/g.51899 Transcript_17090/m.51899 type:complete len:756 (+) Transcript_17090:31-2298(+)
MRWARILAAACVWRSQMHALVAPPTLHRHPRRRTSTQQRPAVECSSIFFSKGKGLSDLLYERGSLLLSGEFSKWRWPTPRSIDEALVEDWRKTAERERVPDRVRRLDASRRNSTFLETLLATSDHNETALEGHWDQLRRECLYLQKDEDLATVRDALKVAYAAHSGQFRRSGEPYVVHPVEVARLLASLRMDVATIAAGLLHDTVEDTPVTFEHLDARFGKDVRRIVEGETKVSKLPGLAHHHHAQPPKVVRTHPPRHVVASHAPGALLSSSASYAPQRRRPKTSTPSSSSSEEFRIAEEQAENLRQMFVAMTEDYRIIVVKLADRLHNMRTLAAMPPHKQLKKARETLEIFAPLAHRLGLWQFKAELEDIAFRYAHPREYEALARALKEHEERHREALEGTREAVEDALSGTSAQVSVSPHTKDLYSLWLKLRKLAATEISESYCENCHFDVDAVSDVIALRVVLDVPRADGEAVEAWRERGVRLCYEALAACSRLDGAESTDLRVKDYVKFPKPNGYQSLHAFVRRSTSGQLVELQIRTTWMHQIAEHGMAAHWLYKNNYLSSVIHTGRLLPLQYFDANEHREFTGAGLLHDFPARPCASSGKNPYAVTWLDSVKTWQREISSSREFIETVRRELLGERVFVFLRDGKILDLSRGATVLDAAFHIHTDVGLHAATAFINGKEVQFSYELQNGDLVTVKTSPDATPQTDWTRWAHRRSTKTKLKAYFKARERECGGSLSSPADADDDPRRTTSR